MHISLVPDPKVIPKHPQMSHRLKYFLVAAAALCHQSHALAGITITGGEHAVFSEKPESSTGLDDIFVVYSADGLKASYTSTSGNAVSWSRYSSLGGGYAEPLVCERDGDTYSITLGSEDMGYIIEDGQSRYYCWVTNYANHRLSLDDVSFDTDQECDRTRLSLTGNAGPVTYYTINGVGKNLSRDIQVEYLTLVYDELSGAYRQVEATETFASLQESFGVTAPLCDTRFSVSGDRFLRFWGEEQSVSTSTYITISVDAHTTAEQQTRDADNEQTVDTGSLGGSAPVVVRFTAAVSDAAIFREWQLSTDGTFEHIDDRYHELEFEYTFRDAGTTYVRFVANNSAATCEYVSDTYDVFIGESALLCPNVFSPNGDGTNDEWRVSYKSIVDFECHIFNRWGQEMCSFTDPSKGWDGRYGGKYVPSGVYYYVIRATGSDGRKYKLDGDINIIKAKRNNITNTTE